MKFWDSSAVVPLVVMEDNTSWARGLMRSDSSALVWALSPVEVRSALARRQREGSLTDKAYEQACGRANRLFRALSHIVALELVRERAIRLLDLHELRAADALQLAAALIASGESPATMVFVSLDQRLSHAARREGFPIESAS